MSTPDARGDLPDRQILPDSSGNAQAEGTHALLVVDEIGYLPVTQDGAVLFFQLINARHERASTVLTSNKGFEERVVCGRGRDPTLRTGDRYKVANCIQAQPVFYGFARLAHGKVISVGVLSVSRCPTGRRPEFARPRRGHPPVEVGDQVSGPVRHAGFRPLDAEHAVFDASASNRHRPAPRRPAGAGPSAEPALGEPVVRTGRSRQAAVGISNGGSRQQRLSDVAVAAGPRQPDVAGAERVPQVEQHRRLPEGGDQGQLREQGQKVLAS